MSIFKHFIPICPTYSMTMYTTVVPDSLGGRGVAKLLADEAFNFAVKEQVPLKPVLSNVDKQIQYANI